MKYLIVGLGNIGPEYHETRHNIGFMAVDALAKAAGATFTDGRYGFTTTLSVKGRQLLLLKPSTFMNLSGNAVRYWMQKEIANFRKSLQVNQKVITAGGIHGVIKEINDNDVVLEIASNVKIRIDKNSIFAAAADANSSQASK